MSRNTDDATESTTSRRSMLRSVGAGAAATVALSGAASGSDTDLSSMRADPSCDCYTDIRCVSSAYCTEKKTQTRECCECDSGTTCDDWSDDGTCCPYTT